jgi:hypothetical protein
MAGDPFTAAIFRWLRAVAADPAQPPAAFECAFVISQRINRASKTAWPSQEVMAADMGLSGNDDAQLRQARRSLKSLVDGGYLLPRRRKHSSTVYQLAHDRTPLSYQEDKTVNDFESDPLSDGDSRADNNVLSTPDERTSVSARTDISVRENGRLRPTNHLNNHLVNQEIERRARAKSIPEDWKLSDSDHDFAVGEGVLNVDQMVAAFIDYYHGEGTAKANWSAVWRRWVRRERQFNQGNFVSAAAAEKMLSRLHQAPDPEPALTDAAWDGIVGLFVKTGRWTRSVDICGHAPPSADCRAPKHILARYGLAEAAA